MSLSLIALVGVALITSVTLMTAGCGAQSVRDSGAGGNNAVDRSGADITETRYDSIYASPQSGVDAPLRAVVRDADEWEAVWRRISADRSPPPARPEVDFSRTMLIVVGLGTRRSGGYAARISRVAEGADGVAVTVEEVMPGPGCIVTQALTAPVIVVSVERVDATVSFIETRRELACE